MKNHKIHTRRFEHRCLRSKAHLKQNATFEENEELNGKQKRTARESNTGLGGYKRASENNWKSKNANARF